MEKQELKKNSVYSIIVIINKHVTGQLPIFAHLICHNYMNIVNSTL